MCQRFKVAGCTVEAVRSRDLNAVARRWRGVKHTGRTHSLSWRRTPASALHTGSNVVQNYSDFNYHLTLKTGEVTKPWIPCFSPCSDPLLLAQIL